MIRSLWRTKWLALVKIPAFVPAQCCCIMSLKYASTRVSPQDSSRKSSRSISSPKCSPVCEVLRSVSPEKSNLVLGFLKECGFSEPQIKYVVSRWPGILLSDPKKTLKPKVEFLLSKGISNADVVRIVLEEPKVLTRGLKNHMIPLFGFLERVAGSEESAARAVRNYPHIFCKRTRRSLELNAMKLQNTGVPKTRISMLILNHARSIVHSPLRFEEAVSMVKEMGVKPTDPSFGVAVGVIGCCSKATWKGKIDLFRSYDLSDTEIVAGFKKQPLIMVFKKERMTVRMNFFVKHMHWCPHKVMMKSNPILMLSLEKRIIPRLSVLYVLVQQGEVLKGEIASVLAFLKMPEKIFVQEYVTRYQDKVPKVLDAHKGKLKISSLHALGSNSAFRKNEFLSGT